jgi:hypothetical protein
MMQTLKLSFRDIVEGRAHIRLGPKARVKLAHMAGAPWSDKDPNAKLHDLQCEVLEHEEREKLVHGASRLGKSVLGGAEGVIEAMLPGSNLAVVAARYDHVAHEWQYIFRGLRTLFKGFPQAFVRLRYVHRPSQHDYDFETIWGAKGRGFSTEADEGAALLGQQFSRAILGEGSHISQEILEKKLLRALDGATMQRRDGLPTPRTGYLSIYTTPKGFEGCSAFEWERVQKQTNRDPRKLWFGAVTFARTVWIREASILENPAYSSEVFEARKATMSKTAFEEQYLGRMTFATGRILAEFDVERHTFPGMPDHALVRKMALGIGLDTGAYFGAVLGGLVRENGVLRRYTLGEVYLEQTPIDDCLVAVESMVVDRLGPVFDVALDDLEDDQARHATFLQLARAIPVFAIDPASQHKPEIAAAWDEADAGLMHAPGLEGGKLELVPSLDVLRRWIAADTFLVSDDCSILLDQIKKYIWKQVKSIGQKNAPVIKEPRKAYDHLIDALRFLFFSLEVHGVRDEAPPPISEKDAWEHAMKERLFGPLRRAKRDAEEMRERWRDALDQ